MSLRPLLDTLARDLALERRPVPLIDRAGLTLAAAGLALCVTLWGGIGIDPRGSLLAGISAWLGALVLQPAVEEALFRGLLQGALLDSRVGRRAVAGLSVANLGATAVFVAAHLVHHSPAWALATAPPSLALGWVRERRGSTWAALALHATFNLEFFATAAWFAR